MIAKTVTFDRIGTFLAYEIKRVHQYGNEWEKITLQSNLETLMSSTEQDHLKLPIFFGLNNYENLNLLEEFELGNFVSEKTQIEACYKNLEMSGLSKKVLQELEKSYKGSFQKPSPCMNVAEYPECRYFCNWHQRVTKNLTIWPSLMYVLIVYNYNYHSYSY